MGRPKRIIRMGNSWSYGDAVALARVLDGVLMGKSVAELREALRNPLAVRAMNRVFRMRERGSAIAAGSCKRPVVTRPAKLDHLEPAFLPPEAADAK